MCSTVETSCSSTVERMSGEVRPTIGDFMEIKGQRRRRRRPEERGERRGHIGEEREEEEGKKTENNGNSPVKTDDVELL
ncbi:hypothetical protein EYF80_059247 [Liparis tanakae]|uniref:Uncharacterized protein n=1 Tax=Liparis tanakae TaxID=230148 RepID=A0A4Z2EQP5_9TELE|nr:hypothetical protein EYF80_059247 [Liparis tanakae]